MSQPVQPPAPPKLSDARSLRAELRLDLSEEPPFRVEQHFHFHARPQESALQPLQHTQHTAALPDSYAVQRGRSFEPHNPAATSRILTSPNEDVKEKPSVTCPACSCSLEFLLEGVRCVCLVGLIFSKGKTAARRKLS
jgi:hypothetical protein